jgi:hypothetical protein
MNRTIMGATVKRFHYGGHEQLRLHLADFMAACGFARRLNTLSGLTAYKWIADNLNVRAGLFHRRSALPGSRTKHLPGLLRRDGVKLRTALTRRPIGFERNIRPGQLSNPEMLQLDWLAAGDSDPEYILFDIISDSTRG